MQMHSVLRKDASAVQQLCHVDALISLLWGMVLLLAQESSGGRHVGRQCRIQVSCTNKVKALLHSDLWPHQLLGALPWTH